MDPSISVIIPVYNDSNGLEETLMALLQQSYPEESFEIIVVDNGSTDFTFEKAKSIGERYPDRIRILQEKDARGSYAARNKGIHSARGNLICFIDANVTMGPDYLSKIDKFFKNSTVDYIGCEVKIYSEHNTLSVKHQKAKAFNVQKYLENRKFAPTCCLSVKRSVINRVGAFDSRLESGGDWEFGRRVHTAGFSQAFAGHITVYHPARWRYRDVLGKTRRCARGEAQLNYYFPREYGDIPQKLLSIWKYIPVKPWRLKRKFEKRGVSTTVIESWLLAFFHIPLNFGRLFTYIVEKKRLNHKKIGYSPQE